jgi:hypothetical protein
MNEQDDVIDYDPDDYQTYYLILRMSHMGDEKLPPLSNWDVNLNNGTQPSTLP